MAQLHDAADTVATTCDAFLGGRLMIRQPRSGYRAGLDAVLLAASVPAEGLADGTCADLGAGVGTVGLCIAMRLPKSRVVLVERAVPLVALAEHNIVANGLADRVGVAAVDLTAPVADLEAAGLMADYFSHVVANPPYQVEGEARAPADPLKAGSHMMAAGGLDRWLRAAARLARPGGGATMIHRADAIHEILAAFYSRFGAITIRPIYPREGEPAIRVIVSGIKGSKASPRVLPGVVVHENNGHGFTPLLQRVLRNGDGF